MLLITNLHFLWNGETGCVCSLFPGQLQEHLACFLFLVYFVAVAFPMSAAFKIEWYSNASVWVLERETDWDFIGVNSFIKYLSM